MENLGKERKEDNGESRVWLRGKGRQRSEFKASLVYVASSKTTKANETLSQSNKNKNNLSQKEGKKEMEEKKEIISQQKLAFKNIWFGFSFTFSRLGFSV